MIHILAYLPFVFLNYILWRMWFISPKGAGIWTNGTILVIAAISLIPYLNVFSTALCLILIPVDGIPIFGKAFGAKFCEWFNKER